MERNLMTLNQLKFFLVDYGKDHIIRDLLSPHKKEVVICLTDFIRIIDSDIPTTENGDEVVLRELTRSGLPFVIYKNLANKAKPIVAMLDWIREKIAKDIDPNTKGINDIHQELYSKYDDIIDKFLIKYGKDLSMFYECFLYNTVLMNLRTLRIPHLQYKEYGQVGYTVPIYPVRIIPKFGPELSILLNPEQSDFATFNVVRERVSNSLELFYASISGDFYRLRLLPTKIPKFDYADLLYSYNIDPADISKSEQTIITHAAQTTDDSETISEITSEVRNHFLFVQVLAFLIADFQGMNENNLKYLVDFE